GGAHGAGRRRPAPSRRRAASTPPATPQPPPRWAAARGARGSRTGRRGFPGSTAGTRSCGSGADVRWCATQSSVLTVLGVVGCAVTVLRVRRPCTTAWRPTAPASYCAGQSPRSPVSSRFWGEYACPAMRTHPKTSNSPLRGRRPCADSASRAGGGLAKGKGGWERAGEVAGRGSSAERSVEDDGAVPGEQHPVLGVPVHRAGQCPALDVLAHRHQFGHVVGMAHPLHVLLDDRPL